MVQFKLPFTQGKNYIPLIISLSLSIQWKDGINNLTVRVIIHDEGDGTSRNTFLSYSRRIMLVLGGGGGGGGHIVA